MELSREAREINKVLREWGIKHSWLAWRLNISKSTLSQYLNGARQLPEKHYKKAKEVLGLA